eukprot:TRINITY_DN108676_c0_g1_i1.p1 TRINITY_DN108676_c0_g1~~TRINITY_DN108676_c0_g1_i1.p1  ORF type:complete len:429 (-),score=85.95 TRINITY_DN108676_c0_g1_i1:145-1431(-)
MALQQRSSARLLVSILIGLAVVMLMMNLRAEVPKPKYAYPSKAFLAFGQRGLVARHALGSSTAGVSEQKSQKELSSIETTRMFPAHRWQPGQRAVVPSLTLRDVPPVMIGVAADTGCGTTTFLRRMRKVLGTYMKPGHRFASDQMQVISVDDYRIHDRSEREDIKRSFMDPREVDFDLIQMQVSGLKVGHSIYKPIYNKVSEVKETPELVEPSHVMIFEGLHALENEVLDKALDLKIYVDVADDIKLGWKARQGIEDRGWSAQQIKQEIEKTKSDFEKFVHPQRDKADFIIRIEASEKGLPYVKVKLIQKKDMPVAPVELTEAIDLPGPVGGKLRSYDDTYFDHPVTIVEMEGEFDNNAVYKDELQLVESRLTGLRVHYWGEFTDTMLNLKKHDIPGRNDGTGLFQAIIAMKIRELYEVHEKIHTSFG